MRTINTIIIHRSATRRGLDFTANDIDQWHRQRGMDGIGYHYVIRIDGTIERGRDIEKVGAHCRGHNRESVSICYIGGLDSLGRPADTRTRAQRYAMRRLIEILQRQFPEIRLVIGHRDVSPDLNGNGRLEPSEWIKSCPCFDVAQWLSKTFHNNN